jgi:hypothetical protein
VFGSVDGVVDDPPNGVGSKGAPAPGHRIAATHRFDLRRERFDIHVMEALASEGSLQARESLVADVRAGRYDHLLLHRRGDVAGISADESERAAINLIDFHFEPLVMRTMPATQANAYFRDLVKVMAIEYAAAEPGAVPLWIDTVHHACVFSVTYQFASHLVLQYGYRSVALLHQGLRPEPRLDVFARTLQHATGVRTVFVRLEGAWFATLSRITTPDTAIFYLTDLPPETTARRAPRLRQHARLHLTAGARIAAAMETLSGSAAFARRLGAAHLVVEYPSATRIRVRPYDAARPVTLCPLADWIFWPAIAKAASGAQPPGSPKARC